MSLFLCFCMLLCQFTSCQPNDNGLLWEISGNGLQKPSFLFATFHPVEERDFEGFLKQVPGFHRSFDAVTQFVMEVELSMLQEVSQSVCGERLLPADSTYSQMLNEEDLSLLDSLTQKYLHAKADQVRLNPNYLHVFWIATISRENMKGQLVDSTKNEGEFLDAHLHDKAIEKGYKVRGLDTPEIRRKLFYRTYWNADSLPGTLKESTSFMIETLKELKEPGDSLLGKEYLKQREKVAQAMKSAYFDKQDLGLVEEYARQLDEVQHHKSDSATMDYLKNNMEITLHERNRLWMQQIPDLIKKEPSFIAVGALHLGGESGLINQLRSIGYTVKLVE